MNNIKVDANKIEQPINLKIKLKEHQKSSIWAMKNLEEKGEVKLELKSAVSKGQILLDHDAIDQDTNIFGNNYC